MNNVVFKAKGFEIRAHGKNGFTLTYNGKYMASMYSSRKKIEWKAWINKKTKERTKAIEKRVAKLYNEIDSLTETLSNWEELPNVIQEEFLKEYQNDDKTKEAKADSTTGNP
jgi:hypothetical protein